MCRTCYTCDSTNAAALTAAVPSALQRTGWALLLLLLLACLQGTWDGCHVASGEAQSWVWALALDAEVDPQSAAEAESRELGANTHPKAGPAAVVALAAEELEGVVAVCAAVDMADLDSAKMMGTGQGEVAVQEVQVTVVAVVAVVAWLRLQGQSLRSKLLQVPGHSNQSLSSPGMGHLLGQAGALRLWLGWRRCLG